MSSPFLGEMLGTLVLVLLGDGVVAGVLLNGTKSQSRLDSGGWLMINTGWAVAVLCGIFVAQATGSPDAHINPAVTIALGALSGDFSKVSSYIPAQMLGAFLGAGLVWLHYHPHWRKTENPDLKLAIFCTGPALRAPVSNLVSEIIATSLLVFVIAAIVSKSVGGATGLQAGFASYLIAMLVWGSASHWAGRPATPSTLRAISVLAWPMRFFRSPEKALQIGAMPPSLLLARS